MKTFPTVHLNGTGGKALIKQNQDAYQAVSEAEEALAKAAPNGRDYYVQGSGALERAVAAHRKRQKALHAVKRELAEIALAVQKQIDDP